MYTQGINSNGFKQCSASHNRAHGRTAKVIPTSYTPAGDTGSQKSIHPPNPQAICFSKPRALVDGLTFPAGNF